MVGLFDFSHADAELLGNSVKAVTFFNFDLVGVSAGICLLYTSDAADE